MKKSPQYWFEIVVPIIGTILFSIRSIDFFISGEISKGWLHIGAALGFIYMYLIYRKKRS